MNTELPLYRQEKPNTCALACLRMVLGAFGTQVAEATIEAQAWMEERGTLITELERLARHFNLVAEIQDTTMDELREILADGKLPVVFIDRAVFDLTRTAATDAFHSGCNHPYRHPYTGDCEVSHVPRPSPTPGHSQDNSSLPSGVHGARRPLPGVREAGEYVATGRT